MLQSFGYEFSVHIQTFQLHCNYVEADSLALTNIPRLVNQVQANN